MLELRVTALCMRVCVFICVAGGLTVWHLQLFILKMQIQAPHPLNNPFLNPRLLSNDFRKSRSDLNNTTKRVSTARNIESKAVFWKKIKEGNLIRMMWRLRYSAKSPPTMEMVSRYIMFRWQLYMGDCLWVFKACTNDYFHFE